MDSNIITTAIVLIGTLANVIYSYYRDKRKADLDQVNTLIQRAMDLNKQELEAVRLINTDLKEQLKNEINDRVTAESKVMELSKRVESLESENFNLKHRLEICETKLNCSKKDTGDNK